MNTIGKIQKRGQVTIPTVVRRQAGLSKGDLVNFAFQRGKIVITPSLIIDRPKSPVGDEYTPSQRRDIDRGIAQSLKEFKQGKASGPFETHEAFLTALRKQPAKKTKRSAR